MINLPISLSLVVRMVRQAQEHTSFTRRKVLALNGQNPRFASRDRIHVDKLNDTRWVSAMIKYDAAYYSIFAFVPPGIRCINPVPIIIFIKRRRSRRQEKDNKVNADHEWNRAPAFIELEVHSLQGDAAVQDQSRSHRQS